MCDLIMGRGLGTRLKYTSRRMQCIVGVGVTQVVMLVKDDPKAIFRWSSSLDR